MRTPLAVYSYQVPVSKGLSDLCRLGCLRVYLFFFTTTFRYVGPSMAIALLLLVSGTSGEVINLHNLTWQAVLLLVVRLSSILLGLMWLSLAVCRLLVPWTKANWKQEMQSQEEGLRCRISVLEDWLVLPNHRTYDGMVEVRYGRVQKPQG